MIGNATFPYKTAISKANVKTKRIRSTKWTHKKNGVLHLTTLILTSYQQLI